MRKMACVAVLLAAALSGGCGASGSPVVAVTPTSPAPVRAKPSAAAAPVAESRAPKRRVGDFMVHLLSGSFREKPALFSERVVGQEAGGLVIEYRLEDNDGARALRAHFDENGEVTRVLRLVGKATEPGTLADYEALLAASTVVPDENHGLEHARRSTCTVGPSELDCLTKSYRVRLGDREAALDISESAALPGRDLSGEITAADGSVIYRSSLVEYGNDRPTGNATAELAAPTPAPAR